jgi:ribonuclease BN (tRNA processing enzyme)
VGESSVITVTVLGSGDAFFSGGRGSSCYLVEDGRGAFTVDLGPSGPLALTRLGIAPGQLDALLLTHLHADHVGGVPFILHTDDRKGRTRPLRLMGPPGTGSHVASLHAACYPRAAREGKGFIFPLDVSELAPDTAGDLAGRIVRALPANHQSPPNVALMLRVETAGRVLAFTGDTGDCDALRPLAQGADLLVCECTLAEPGKTKHLSVAQLRTILPTLGVRRILLSHLSAEARAAAPTLARDLRPEQSLTVADDLLRVAV